MTALADTKPRARTLLRAALNLTCAAAAAALGSTAHAAPARNVIVFLGDAGGVSTINAAGILAHDRPQSLFIHSMPHVALSDTSSLDRWVSDSAAGMTAIMTGRKTNNGMVSVVPASAGGAAGGVTPGKKVLEK